MESVSRRRYPQYITVQAAPVKVGPFSFPAYQVHFEANLDNSIDWSTTTGSSGIPTP
jgi:hypothetical protein